MTAVLLALVLAQPAPPQAPARDARKVATGTGRISGVVVTSDREARPLRRARVTIFAPEIVSPRTAVTDDRGAFSVTDLPAGKYTLNVAKEVYAPMAYGASRPGRPGTSIALADGQHVSGLSIQLQRGAVITGTVLDHTGHPPQYVYVRAARYQFINGERRLVPAGGTGGMVDDRGIYRVFGLPAGEYIIVATPQVTTVAPTELTTAADVARAKRALAAPASVQNTPGAQSSGGVAPPAAARRTIALSPVYYPGTAVLAQAALITVAAGEERTGVDMQLQHTPTTRVEGTVSSADGNPLQGVSVSLLDTGAQMTDIMMMLQPNRTARPGPDGRFSFNGVSPGTYVIAARGSIRGQAPRATTPGTTPPTAPLWALADLTVDGNEIPDVSLTLQPGMTVSGRLQFEGSTPPPDLTRVRAALVAVGTPVNLGVAPAVIDAAGTFTLAGVTPGRYRIMANIPPSPGGAPRWFIKSSIVQGRDTLDAAVEIRPQQHVEGAVLTFTDSPSEISGRLQDASGKAATDYHIIVFSADRSHWMPQSRRVQVARPSHDGSYSIRNLPAGDYLVVALIDVEPGEWMDPAFLQRVAPAGMKLTLADGEKKVQDLQLR